MTPFEVGNHCLSLALYQFQSLNISRAQNRPTFFKPPGASFISILAVALKSVNPARESFDKWLRSSKADPTGETSIPECHWMSSEQTSCPRNVLFEQKTLHDSACAGSIKPQAGGTGFAVTIKNDDTLETKW
ncbi:hypothetical protein AVEN_125995-1 [Araneus ventricosus]|uniref:Uncharacterized protein n=1 Tax=Araneus ventricosus TaxID=182803 RepID=A0A4Y2PWY3_ARAVE|nr:hypothetical protein AVEN_125995-1 [Araneus ventricosus]